MACHTLPTVLCAVRAHRAAQVISLVLFQVCTQQLATANARPTAVTFYNISGELRREGSQRRARRTAREASDVTVNASAAPYGRRGRRGDRSNGCGHERTPRPRLNLMGDVAIRPLNCRYRGIITWLVREKRRVIRSATVHAM